jgi:hypothetical protein
MSVSKLSRGGESGGDGLVFRVAKVDAGIAILISDVSSLALARSKNDPNLTGTIWEIVGSSD